jgi:hypothetical protein
MYVCVEYRFVVFVCLFVCLWVCLSRYGLFRVLYTQFQYQFWSLTLCGVTLAKAFRVFAYVVQTYGHCNKYYVVQTYGHCNK